MNLKQMTIINFKGVKDLVVDFGDMTDIAGKNGSGKTSIFDAYLWLLFGKNSKGETSFDVRPLDGNGEPMLNLITMVEAVLDCPRIQGVKLRKEFRCKFVKGEFAGNESSYWINEVPSKKKEFDAYVNDIIEESRFKMLSALHFFNEKMHWIDRRKTLLELAGTEIEQPQGYEALLKEAGERTVDDYRKVVMEQLKKLNKQQAEITPRIDELVRGMPTIGSDVAELEAKRQKANQEIETLLKKRSRLVDEQRQQDNLIKKISRLKAERADYERKLQAAKYDRDSYAEQMSEITQGVFDFSRILNEYGTRYNTAVDNVFVLKRKLEVAMAEKTRLSEQIAKMKEEKPDNVCRLCGQQLPEDKIKSVEDDIKSEIEAMTSQAQSIIELIKKLKQEILDAENVKCTCEAQITDVKHKRDRASYEADRKKAALEVEYLSKKVDFEADTEWCRFSDEIAEAQREFAAVQSLDFSGIDEAILVKREYVKDLDTSLAQADRMKQDKQRIEQLKQQEKDLGEQIAELEGVLEEINEYKHDQAVQVEQAVNGMFKHVSFKMFNTLINGSIEECCEAVYNGTPYSGCSTGEKIIMGIDVVNVFSGFYGENVPLFIDNAESLTLPIDTETQVIRLIADPKKDNLKIAVFNNQRKVA
jgi:DNA repair protein SbcC/Rad50